MGSDEQQLQTVLQAQKDHDNDPSVTTQIILEMKSSLIFQISWQDLLQSGPTSINSMGACFAASTNPKAVLILKPPPQGFKYLKYESVKANLVECGNLGRFAFIEAEAGMGVIQMTSTVMNGKMGEVLKTIHDPPTAKKLLKPQLSTIQNGAQSCLEAINKIDQKFDEWLMYACELHAACVAEEQSTTEAIASSEVCVAAEQSRLEGAKASVAQAKKSSDLLEKQVQMAGDAFKTASDKFPTGWDIMGQQIVGDLAHCLTSALNAAIPALVDNLNPMKKLKAAGDVVGSFVHPSTKPSDGTDPSSQPASGGQPPPVVPKPSAAPKDATDPAYVEVIKIQTYMSALNSIVHGNNDDIGWDRAAGENGAKSSVKFLEEMLSDHVSQFAQVVTDSDPSQTLKVVLDVSKRIAVEIESELQKAKEPQHNYPEKTSKVVQDWQRDFTAQYNAANKLAAVARSMPGQPASGIPVVADKDVEIAQTNARTTQAQAVLDAAKNRLETTQSMLTTSQTNYVKANEELLKQQNRLDEIQSDLIKATQSNLTMKEVKAILISCIKLIIQLKQQITDLVRFFNAFTVIIEVAVKTHVTPFLKTVTAIVTNGASDSDLIKIADYSLGDLERTMVYSAIVTIRSYFGIFSDIAKMWIQLSNENIMPGLKLCDECASAVDSDENASQTLKGLVNALQKWSTEASKNVAKLAGDKQKEMMDGMQERIDNVQTTTKELEPPPAATKQAIASGTDVNDRAGKKYIEDKAKQAAVNRFSDIGDI